VVSELLPRQVRDCAERYAHSQARPVPSGRTGARVASIGHDPGVGLILCSRLAHSAAALGSGLVLVEEQLRKDLGRDIGADPAPN
jgi:hypothetical protein